MRSAAARLLRDDERGAVTAEFALLVPVLLLVLGVSIGAVHLAAERVGLVLLAGEVARLEARGDSARAAERIAAADPGPELSRTRSGGILCVTARSGPGFGLLSGVRVAGRGCAAIVETPGT